MVQHASSRFAWTVTDGNFIIGVHSTENPSNEEWEGYLAAGRAALAAEGSVRSLAYSLGGGPNSLQRSQTNELFKGSPQRVAVMLNSALTRGVVTALSWFNPEIRAFNLEQLDAACEYLGLSPEKTREVEALIKQMLEAMTASGT